MKLVLHGVHQNKANVFNQVSLLALNFLGVPFGSLDQPVATNSLMKQPTTHDIGGFRFEDEIRFDPATLAKLRQLQVSKREAVMAEDFKEA